jgi:formylglycine-generating enzyme required for sulfatase activity
MEAADLEARQLAVLMLIQREWPHELTRLHEVLLDHPTDAVRAWWRELTGREGLEAVVSPRGGVELVLVPGGRFVMGSAWPTGDRDEQPRREVELHSFYMARAPVTNAQYAEYLRANPCATPPRFRGNDHFNRPNQPVVGISWHDAQAFCEWAGLELPSEAQWEHACRAGTQTRFWSGDGDDDLERVGWCFTNSNGRLQPVGTKDPNGFGLHDMHGNIWEWCRDAYGSYETSPRVGDGLRHAPDGAAKRVRRGGGFRALADFARSALRGHAYPEQRHDDLGLRPIRSIRGSSWPGSSP